MTDVSGRVSSGRLARLGFANAREAADALARLEAETEIQTAVLPDDLGRAADPDLALAALVTLADAVDDRGALAAAIGDEPGFRRRLVAVLGASDGLGRHLARHPEHWIDLSDSRWSPDRPDADLLRTQFLNAVDADPHADRPVAQRVGEVGGDRLRITYRRHLLRLAARDLTADDPVAGMDDIARELSDLASGVLEAALALARADLPDHGSACRFAVIGMGKCGGRELNYVSDVDVVFVAEAADDETDERTALVCGEQLATRLIRICSAHTAAGTIWPVDAALRPEGKAGPLVRTLASHRAYAQRWAKAWEFQAGLKARPIAGDVALGDAYVDGMAEFVWKAADGEGFVDGVRAMRRRVVDHIPAGQVDRQLKLGPGGLRDVEFAVQLLQLVHGRSDETLRSPTTLVALEALTTGGYVGREDGAKLADAYRFLRTLEHRLQLFRLRRIHLLPDDAVDLRRLGRSVRLMTEPETTLMEQWRRHALEVRRLHEKLFYRPLLSAVARLPTADAKLTTDAARARLTALGYADPGAALRHIEALTAGVSRRAAIQRTLLPAMLGWFADAADPDAGLLAFRQVSDTLGATHWYLRLLRDEGAAAEHVARLLASSRYVSDLLRRAPQGVAMLAEDDELRPRTREPLEAEMATAASRYDRPDQAVTAIRAVRRRELFRIGASDILGRVSVDEVGEALTAVTAATLSAALGVAIRATETKRGSVLPTRLAIVAMGRLGGHEMSYASDADVMFVHDPVDGAEEKDATDAAMAVVSELRRLLAAEGADPPLGLDAALRPEGKQGPIVRTLASYAAYYARWSHVWEAQALLRAEVLCGDAGLQERFRALIDPLRWPKAGPAEDDVREIRRLKARMDAERLPRDADPNTHTKLGRGGLTDIEWTVQLLQLRHAHRVPGLRTTRTLAALDAAVAGEVLPVADAAALADAWRLVARARNAVTLARAKPSDSLPHETRDRAAVARLLGYGPDGASAFIDDYLKVTRHAHQVVEKTFWA